MAIKYQIGNKAGCYGRDIRNAPESALLNKIGIINTNTSIGLLTRLIAN